MQTLTRIIRGALCLPDGLLIYEVGLRLQQIYPDKYILETEDHDFDLPAFAEAGRCRTRLLDHMHAQLDAKWRSRAEGGVEDPRNALQEIVWKTHTLRVLKVSYGDCERRYYIIADSASVAKTFFARVCAFSSEVSGEILVFREGWWTRDKNLLEQIAEAKLENLVLPDHLRTALLHDFEGFFQSRDFYTRQGVPWKRGILMLGPPGNGKTHAIKAMVNRLAKPCIYVRSFRSERGTIHGNIGKVFHRARQAAPCVLVMEDLDTLVDNKNLSYFLNEMDDFAANQGILTVATTNHPEKLDVALLERPSRFDRKITFGLPAQPERREFLARSNARQEQDLQMSEGDLDRIADLTEGFSFAYLKELTLSGTMAWMRTCQAGGMAEVMTGQIEALRAQMKTDPGKEAPDEDEADD